MRKLFFFCLMLGSAWMCADAQDIITLTDGSTIQAKVVEVGTSQVKYRLFNVPESDVLTISTSQLRQITYESGDMENFNTGANGNVVAGPATDSPVAIGPTINKFGHFLISYTASFDAVSKGSYGFGWESFFSSKRYGFGISWRLRCNAGIVDSDYATYCVSIGANYGYAVTERFAVFAPLTFNAAFVGKDSKFGWGFALIPSAVYSFGKVGISAGIDLEWAHGADKIHTGFDVGICFGF